MKKAGILCASDTELAPFLKVMEVSRVTEKAMLKFYEGRIQGIPAVAVYSGVCKVNAAVAAERLGESTPKFRCLTQSWRSVRFITTWQRTS